MKKNKKKKPKNKNQKIINKDYFGKAIKYIIKEVYKNEINPDKDSKISFQKQSFSQSGIGTPQIITIEKRNKKEPEEKNLGPTIYKRKSKFNKLFPNNSFLNVNEKISERQKINKDKINLSFRENKKKNNNQIYEEILTKNNNKNNKITKNESAKFNCRNFLKNLKLSQTDEDLQDMDYKDAINNDNRPYLRMYWSFLVDSQIILGTFFTENYLDLFIIKLSFFVCTFQISFFLNALFYTDEYISDAYHNEGILNFFSGLPKAIYSLIATLITTNLLKMLSNSKSELMEIIRNKEKEINYIDLINIKLKKLRNKLITYFIFVFVLGLFFFYYVSSFCAVYRNSQKYWFIGCLESFAMDLMVAIIICLIISSLRYLSLKKQVKCLYVLVNFINKFV